MSYKSVKALVSMLAGICLIIVYAIFATGGSAPINTDIAGWSKVMLVFVGISIVVMMIIQILFHIFYTIKFTVNEKNCDDNEVERIVASSMVEDEMDEMVQLKGMRLSYRFVAAGFLL